MNKGDARMLAGGAQEVLVQMRALETELESWTRNLEKAATAYLKAQHRLPRAGMWAHIRTADQPFEIPGQIHFHVSNGIDTDDDFGAFLTFEQLESDPAGVKP